AHTPVKRIVVFAPAFLTASARDLRLQSSTSLSAETGAPARTQHERNNTVGRRIFNLHHLRVNETQTWEQTEADGLDARWCTSEPTDASMRFRERYTMCRRRPTKVRCRCSSYRRPRSSMLGFRSHGSWRPGVSRTDCRRRGT